MSEHYPRIRHRGLRYGHETLLVREGIRIIFYMPLNHQAVARGVEQALDIYLRATASEPQALNHCWDTMGEGDQLPLDSNGWDFVRGHFNPPTEEYFADEMELEDPVGLKRWTKRQFEVCISIAGGDPDPNGYSFFYKARIPWRTQPEGNVSLLWATLPTEYLEARGPGRVRELALAMASVLSFSTGHAGLAFDLSCTVGRAMPLIRDALFRYPGIALLPVWVDWKLGTRVDDVHWLNFLGSPVLTELGGAAELRRRLNTPGTTVQQLAGERAVVTLGPWPEAGDLTQSQNLPAYRELARVLAPWLFEFSPAYAASWEGVPEEQVRHWWHRFLE